MQAKMRLDDHHLEKLGTYFVYHHVYERYGITFERFIQKVLNGTWEAYLA